MICMISICRVHVLNLYPDIAPLPGILSVPTWRNNGTGRGLLHTLSFNKWNNHHGLCQSTLLDMFSLQITPPPQSRFDIIFFFFCFGLVTKTNLQSRANISSIIQLPSGIFFIYFCIFFHHGIQTITSSSLHCLAHCSKSSQAQRAINTPDTLGEPLLILIFILSFLLSTLFYSPLLLMP